MNVLITNIWLDDYAGTEVFVRDLAILLQSRGINVMVYSPRLGLVAKEIERQGIFVTDDIAKVYCMPDIIHAQHTIPALEAIIHFPETPVVYYVHDRTFYGDTPVKHPQVIKYLASDHNTKDRLMIDEGIPAEHIEVLLNWVDTRRFRMRKQCAATPRKALIFSNRASRDTYIPAIEAACVQTGLELHTLGMVAGNATNMPETVLADYDIIFAKAKAAIESMATAAAVIPCDDRGLGEMVSLANYDHLRKFNFGMRILNRPIETELIVDEIRKYHAADAHSVALRIREEADIQKYADRLLQHYNDAIKKYGSGIRVYTSKNENLVQAHDGGNKTVREYVNAKDYAVNQLLSAKLRMEHQVNLALEAKIVILETRVSRIKRSFSFRFINWLKTKLLKT